MSSPVLRLHKLCTEAIAPQYQTHGAAGLDLCACISESIVLGPSQRVAVPTGLALSLPEGHEGQVRPRSGLAAKHGITVLNAPGTIDEDYRGELKVLLVNLGTEPFTIQHGERIAQLVINRVTRVAVLEVDEASQLGTTQRGTGGFGSTGR